MNTNKPPTMVVEKQTNGGAEIMEAVLAKGDLAKLTADERNRYYVESCRSLGLNPLTKPFEYIVLNGRMTLYARRDAADQLRKINSISIEIVSREFEADLLTVHVRAKDKTGRIDEDFGVVNIGKLQGEAKANAILKCITKAKRRVTLSISGLGWLDETEIADIPANAKIHLKTDSIHFEGDYAGGTPEKFTKPKEEPKFSRAEAAAEAWEAKADKWQREMSECESMDALHEWGTANSIPVSGAPDHIKSEIYTSFKKQLEWHQQNAVADQVVHDGDALEPRPARWSDFPDEPETTSERAIAAREKGGT